MTSASEGPEHIASQAQDALASAIGAGMAPPPAIADGAIPPRDLGDYHNPLVVLVSYEPVVVA